MMEQWNGGIMEPVDFYFSRLHGLPATIPVFQQSNIPLFEWAAVKHEPLFRASAQAALN
jgi:hypothetical protein